MRVTVTFVVFTIGFEIGLGLIFVVILNNQLIGRSFFRSVILPVVLSTVAVSLAFMLIFHPQKGPLNNFLMSLGSGSLLLADRSATALPTVIFIDLAKFRLLHTVLLLSGLQTTSSAHQKLPK